MTKTFFDPESILIESLAGETAIDPALLTPQWLRERFANPPDWMPEVSHESLLRQDGELTAAAVLLPLVVREHGVTLLLTQRSAHLTDHPGQISLPGGRMEETDADAIATALRETEEEVGLSRAHVEVIGTLPEYATGTGYRIVPVVGIVQPPFTLQADPSEVAEVFEVPLSFLLDGMNHQRRSGEFPGRGKRTFYAMPYGRFFIWGATAHILRNLFHMLRT